MAHKLVYWEDKEKTFEESKKSSSRTEFCKNSYGAYRVAKKNGKAKEKYYRLNIGKIKNMLWRKQRNTLLETTLEKGIRVHIGLHTNITT